MIDAIRAKECIVSPPDAVPLSSEALDIIRGWLLVDSTLRMGG